MIKNMRISTAILMLVIGLALLVLSPCIDCMGNTAYAQFTASYCVNCHSETQTPTMADRHHLYVNPPSSYTCTDCHAISPDNPPNLIINRNCLDCHTPRTISSATVDNGRVTVNGSGFAALAKSYGVYISNDGTAITCPTTPVSWTDTKIIVDSSSNPDGAPCAKVDTIAVVPCAAVEKVLTAEAPPTGTIKGKVFDTKARVIAGATISTDIGGYTTITAADGTYSLTVDPGTYAVTASATGFYSLSATVTVTGGATAIRDFILTATPPEGTPFTTSYCVNCHSETQTPTMTDRHHQYVNPPLSYGCSTCHAIYLDSNNVYQAIVDRNCLDCHAPRTISSATVDNGRVTVNGSGFAALAKSYGVYISNDGTAITCPTTPVSWTDTKIIVDSSSNPDGTPCAQVAEIAVVPCAAVEKVLTAGTPLTATISGKVTDATTGAPIAGATVCPDSSICLGTTGPDGAYSLTLSFPSAGTWNVTVTASAIGYNSSSATVSVTTGGTVTRNFALTAIPTTGTLTGTVTDAATGALIPNVTVCATPLTGLPLCVTESAGSYSLTVPSGTYTVTASATGYATATATTVIVFGGTTTLNFALTPIPTTGTLTGTVTDSKKGIAIAGATISTNTGGYTTTTAADGTYSLTVNVGTYTVTVSKAGYTSKSATVTIAVDQTRIVNFALSRSKH